MTTTFLEAIVESLLALMKEYNKQDVISPQVVLWADKNREWETIIPKLRQYLPIITLGLYKPEYFQGPAIYLRCLASGKLEGLNLHEDKIPIIYLPGYSREIFGNLEDCPEPVKPLAYLQYHGVIWSQKNGKDWTINAFIQSQRGGLGIHVSSDDNTRDTLKRTVGVLADVPVEYLRSKEPLNASFLNELYHPDPSKRILQWMNDPVGEKSCMNSAEWKSFKEICRNTFDFDPDTDGIISAVKKLGEQEGNWKKIWERFRETPQIYKKIPSLLRQAQQSIFTTHEDSWPVTNDEMEKDLCQEFLNLKKLSIDEARNHVLVLEKKHSKRRKWVWAELEESSLAMALESLSFLAENTKNLRFGGGVAEQAERYAKETWKVDDAVIRALAYAKDRDSKKAIETAIIILYGNWLDRMAEAFQKEWKNLPPIQEKENCCAKSGEIFLFVDGLRMDLGHYLCQILEDEGYMCEISYRYSVIPTLTATAKPAVMPIAGQLYSGEKFAPKTSSGAIANINALRSILKEKDFQVLESDEDGDPSKAAWTDYGNIDHEGHDKGVELPLILKNELHRIKQRIVFLLDAGWQTVKVVTDHGWLLLPGSLNKTDLDSALVELKKGRCAQLRPEANVNFLTVPWFWDRNVRIAIAPGSTCFEAGNEYAHGGISPQEIVIPQIVISNSSKRKPKLISVQESWSRLRCKVEVEESKNYFVDIRMSPADESSSVVQTKMELDENGKASLIVEKDECEGEKALLVILDSLGTVIYQKETTIGG